MTILYDILKTSEKKLHNAGFDIPALDAQILVGHALDFDRTQLFARGGEQLLPDEIAKIEMLVERRLKHEPVGRILGEREFWSLPFGLNEATLEPRPDSETLVEAVLSLKPPTDARILDLGTGTGCLLLSLLHELPHSSGIGVDIAPRAVEQARQNSAQLGLDKRSMFRTGNWLEGITAHFDVIISNPPYIAHDDLETLMPEVRLFDPMLVLDGGKDGLTVYRKIIAQIPERLKSGGITAFEVGQGQATQVASMLKAAGFKQISIHKDLGGIERCICAIKP